MIKKIFNFIQMTRAQIKKTMTIMKNQCMPKHGVTNGKKKRNLN